jgi:hypothetical protein
MNEYDHALSGVQKPFVAARFLPVCAISERLATAGSTLGLDDLRQRGSSRGGRVLPPTTQASEAAGLAQLVLVRSGATHHGGILASRASQQRPASSRCEYPRTATVRDGRSDE